MSSVFLNQTILKYFSTLFADSKYFVDSCLLVQEQIFHREFAKLVIELGDSDGEVNSTHHLMKFYRNYFRAPKIDFGEYPSHGSLFDEIKSPFLQWVQFLFETYVILLRSSPSNEECTGSLLPTSNSFIVPGGRFSEAYYWDTFWMMKGLIFREIRLGMLFNFRDFIDKYGFIPNGNRIYYLNRSQPPMFTQMVHDELFRAKNVSLLLGMLPYLDKEYEWWMSERSIEYGGYRFNLYMANSSNPRPESFKEDLDLLRESRRDPQDLFSNLAAGAESGWDFSSRWFDTWGDFGSINLNSLIPVDLNSIFCANERYLSFMHAIAECIEIGDQTGKECLSKYSKMGHDEDVELALETSPGNNGTNALLRKKYAKASRIRRSAINEILYDEVSGTWRDFDLNLSKHRRQGTFLSSIFPVWNEAYSTVNQAEKSIRIFNESFFDYIGGIPTSLFQSGQQWDFPNAWPPLQWVVIEALLKLPNIEEPNTAHPFAKELVPMLMQRWITSNYCGWRKANPEGFIPPIDDMQNLHKRNYNVSDQSTMAGMFEKYNVLHVGSPGLGGEYVVQDGFGWTNGVVLDFIRRFSRWKSDKDLPEWFKYENELEFLDWNDGLILPSDAECSRLIGSSIDTTPWERSSSSPYIAFRLSMILLVLCGLIYIILNSQIFRKTKFGGRIILKVRELKEKCLQTSGLSKSTPGSHYQRINDDMVALYELTS